MSVAESRASSGDDEAEPVRVEDRYNLAGRVYTDNKYRSNDTETTDKYNLAARVHSGTDGDQAANISKDGVEAYNLAARVHGNGAVEHAPSSNMVETASPTGASVVAPSLRAQPDLAPPQRPTESPPSPPRRTGRTFESLRVPGFRWFFIAQFGMFGAMNMQMLVNGYLVFILTGSFAALGTVALARSLPGLLLSMVGGVMADRLPRKYLVQAGQLVSAIVSGAVGILILFDMLRFEHLLVSSVFQGATMAIMMPARQAMLPALVGMDRLQNAVALGMGAMNVMRMIGPALGGFLLASMGGEYAYFAVTAFYLSSVLIYFRVPNTPNESPISPEATSKVPSRRTGGDVASGANRASRGAVTDIIEGFKYVLRDRTIGMLLVVNLVIVLVSMPYQMMLPGFVVDVLNGGPQTLGILQAIAAIGSLFGIFVIASMPNRHRGRVMLIGALVMGIALLGFSVSTVVLITAPIMVVISLGQTFRMSLSSVLLQTYVNDAYRGRVMSLFMMEMNLVSFATFITGIMAAIFGIQLAIGGMAFILVILSVALLLFVPRIRDLD